MILYGKASTPPTTADFIITMGQSHAMGRQEPTRLQNTNYNYKGIGAGYPTVRSGQDQYVLNPSGVYIYEKFLPGGPTDPTSVDDGSWAPYVAGTNSTYRGKAFGPELSCATRISDQTGNSVYIVKCAFGGTGLSNTCVSSSSPGNWNTALRIIAAENYLRRAMRDFRTANPTIRPRLLAINWWQGEQDAVESISSAVYQAQYALFRTYWQGIIQGLFVEQDFAWNVTKLKFNENANEATINSALAAIASTYADTYLVDATPYPQGDSLTVSEASPMATGTPTTDGGNDDNHVSYIGILGVGEYMADNIIAHHGL